MTTRRLIQGYLSIVLAGLIVASQWVAFRLNYHPSLGGVRIGQHLIYPPWALLVWAQRFGPAIPRTLNEGYAVVGGSFVLATVMLIVGRQFRRRIPVREVGKDRWATKRDMKAARLFSGKGIVLGQFGGVT